MTEHPALGAISEAGAEALMHLHVLRAEIESLLDSPRLSAAELEDLARMRERAKRIGENLQARESGAGAKV